MSTIFKFGVSHIVTANKTLASCCQLHALGRAGIFTRANKEILPSVLKLREKTSKKIPQCQKYFHNHHRITWFISTTLNTVSEELLSYIFVSVQSDIEKVFPHLNSE